MVEAIAQRCAEDQSEADDIVQDIWARVISLWEKKSPNSPTDAWVKSVASKVALQARDRRVRWARLKQQVRATPVERVGDQEEDLEAGIREKVERAVSSLPPRQREIVKMRAYEDLSVAETAARARRAEGTVKATYHQALGRLARELEPLRSAWRKGEIVRRGDPK